MVRVVRALCHEAAQPLQLGVAPLLVASSPGPGPADGVILSQILPEIIMHQMSESVMVSKFPFVVRE